MELQYRTIKEAFPLGGIKHEEPELLAARGMFGAGLDGIQRYETSKERQMYRALHEFQRLQAARQNTMALPPVAIAVDIRGDGPS